MELWYVLDFIYPQADNELLEIRNLLVNLLIRDIAPEDHARSEDVIKCCR